MRWKSRFLGAFLSALVLFGAAQEGRAALNAVAPAPFLVSPSNAPYPLWYQDKNGLGLDLCLVNDPHCILLADPGFNPVNPVEAPAAPGALFNFPQEAFYFSAVAQMGQGNKTNFRAAVEGAWATGPVVFGTEITFARLQIKVDVPDSGVGVSYTVTHPYGVETFVPTSPGVFLIKRDVGLGGPPFTGALGGFSTRPDVFLERAAGRLVGAGPFAGLTFIGNPALEEPVTGSPFGTNFFRVVGPVFDASGAVVPSLEIALFKVMGLVTGGVLPTPLTVTSATYHRTADVGSVDILATSSPTAVLTAAGGPNLPAGPNPLTGVGGHFVGTFQLTPDTSVVPTSVTVTATDAGPPAKAPATVTAPVKDAVTIAKAHFDDVKHTLTIQATSSDAVAPPLLTAMGFGFLTPDSQGIPTLVVSALGAPPASVTVTSAAGGSATLGVMIGAENLTVTQASFRLSTRTWLVSGRTTVPGSTIRIFNRAKPTAGLIGKVTADALGVWKFVKRNSRVRPTAARKISLVSTGGGRLLNRSVRVRP